jgi:hypothetical protein
VVDLQPSIGRCDGVGSGGQRQYDPFFISLLLTSCARHCRCPQPFFAKRHRPRQAAPAPVELPVAPAMTGKALFRRLAAERRHGDGEGGIAAASTMPLLYSAEWCRYSPRPSLPPVLTGERCLTENVAAAVQAAARRGGGA